ncbi:hypothetical protein [Lysobacter panacisoli]|uniref:DUF3325 domain-containing protein n=1 Tax=Lysobacter panacisoli TaxID=1255263 RepID=A0ABP9L4C4_9GAMM|nr:hypothetical protein [Lysobacter panacisoli]
MIVWSLSASAALAILGAILLYIASPQQQLLRRGPWPTRAHGWPGTLCVLASLALLWPRMGSAAAVATWFTLLMLVWTLIPFAGAWCARRREHAR